jgi:hypothetical protein
MLKNVAATVSVLAGCISGLIRSPLAAVKEITREVAFVALLPILIDVIASNGVNEVPSSVELEIARS